MTLDSKEPFGGQRRGATRAFSLVEVLMVVGVLAGLAAGAVLYIVSGQGQSLALDFQASALQSTQLLAGHLQRDVSNLMPRPLLDTFATPVPSNTVSLLRLAETSDPGALPLDGQGQPLVESVNWSFDPQTHLLSRNGEPIRGAPMESVEFTYFPCRPDDPTPPYGDTLIVRMVAVPLEALGRAGVGGPRVTVTAVFHSAQGTVNHLHEDWVGDTGATSR